MIKLTSKKVGSRRKNRLDFTNGSLPGRFSVIRSTTRRLCVVSIEGRTKENYFEAEHRHYVMSIDDAEAIVLRDKLNELYPVTREPA